MTVRSILPHRIHGRFRAPPSKSYTHRAYVAAYLSGRGCEIVAPLESDDTRATRDGLRALGAVLHRTRRGWRVSPPDHDRRTRVGRTVRCGESGTTLRLLTAVAALAEEPVTFEGALRLSERPMGELYRALRALGATVRPHSATRALPCIIHGPLTAGKVAIRGDVSSQFISALLMVLPTLSGRSEITVRGPTVSEPYIDATRAVLQRRGIRIRPTRHGFLVPGDQRYRAGQISVPGDASSAAYLWAGAAATGGRVDVVGIPTDLPQADLAILPILSAMGARVQRTAGVVRVTGPLTRPVSIDLTDFPDLFPLIAVLASLIPRGRSQLRGAPHLQFKESDRRTQSVRLALAVGADVSEHPSRIEVIGTGSPRSLSLPSLADHRLVMSAAIAGLAGPSLSRIGRAEAVSKSFPGFWDALRTLTRGGRPAP